MGFAFRGLALRRRRGVLLGQWPSLQQQFLRGQHQALVEVSVSALSLRLIDYGLPEPSAPKSPSVFRTRQSSCRMTVTATVTAYVDHRKVL